MAHSLSAKKRIRQNARRRMLNRARKSAVKTQIKRFMETARTHESVADVEKELRLAQKKIDKLVAKGTMHKNTAARRKAQLMRRLNEVKATQAG